MEEIAGNVSEIRVWTTLDTVPKVYRAKPILRGKILIFTCNSLQGTRITIPTLIVRVWAVGLTFVSMKH